MTTLTPIVPPVHLNGSGLRNLTEERMLVRNSLHTALEHLYRMTPHPRDYYIVDGLYEMAMAQHLRRADKLQHLINEIEAELAILEGGSL